MLYKEPYTIPAALYENPEVTPTAKLIWGYITKFHKKGDFFNKDLAAYLGITPRALIQFKKQLATHGYLEKVIEKGQIRYVPIDPVLKTQKKLELFMTVTKFFKNLPSSLLLELLNDDPEKLLYTLEVLEWTYLGHEPPRYADRLLIKAFKKGVEPGSGFKPGFWEENIRSSALLKARNQAKITESEDLKRQKQYENWLKTAKKKDIKALQKLADTRINGTLPDNSFRRLAVQIKMQEIWEEQNAGN